MRVTTDSFAKQSVLGVSQGSIMNRSQRSHRTTRSLRSGHTSQTREIVNPFGPKVYTDEEDYVKEFKPLLNPYNVVKKEKEKKKKKVRIKEAETLPTEED